MKLDLTNLPKREHFRNGGSSIARRSQCPGSLMMEEPYPPTTTAAADTGTRVHALIEKLIPGALLHWDKKDKFVDAPSTEHDAEEEVIAAKRACLQILDLIGSNVPNVHWAAETKFVINEKLELGGTADFAWGYYKGGKKIIELFDYKNGVLPHYADSSMQIKQYLCGIQYVLGKKKPFDVLIGHIFQPNSLNQSKTYTRAEYSAEDIEKEIARQIEVAKRSLGYYGVGELKLKAGPECFFCQAKYECAEFHGNNADKALAVLDLHDKKPVAKVTEKEINEVQEIVLKLTDAQLKDFVLQVPYIRQAIKAVEKHVIDRHLTGKPIQGLRCVWGQGRRGWAADLDMEDIGNGLKKMGVEKPFRKQLRTLGDIETDLKMLGMNKTEAKEALEPLVAKSTPTPNIVPDSEEDTRPEIELGSADDAQKALAAVDCN